jgi:hypothetical protein
MLKSSIPKRTLTSDDVLEKLIVSKGASNKNQGRNLLH